MDTIDVDGLRIAYERAGAGPAVVLLHGYVGDGATTWRRQIDALSDDFTVVAWDAPGAGGSSDPPESFGMAGTRTVWPDSSPVSVWRDRSSSGFRLAGPLRSSSVGGIPPFPRPSFWRPPTPAGEALCPPKLPHSVYDRR